MKSRVAASAAFLILAGGLCRTVFAEDKPLPPEKPAAQKQVAKPAKAAPRPKRSGRTDFELMGFTSETTNQFHSRLNLTRRNGPKQWFVKTGYGATRTRTYSKNRVNTTELDTITLDAQYRRDRRKTYNFFAAAATVRNRSPYTTTYGDLSGYYLVSAGVGRKLMSGLEGELALAYTHRYQDDDGSHILPVYTLRLRSPIRDVVTLDGEANFIEPFTDEVIVDSRLNLTYRLTPALSLRLTCVANNLLTPITSRTGWDRSVRVSVVFSRVTQ